MKNKKEILLICGIIVFLLVVLGGYFYLNKGNTFTSTGTTSTATSAIDEVNWANVSSNEVTLNNEN